MVDNSKEYLFQTLQQFNDLLINSFPLGSEEENLPFSMMEEPSTSHMVQAKT